MLIGNRNARHGPLSRCSAVRYAAGGRGFLRRRSSLSLIISCKNSRNSGGASVGLRVVPSLPRCKALTATPTRPGPGRFPISATKDASIRHEIAAMLPAVGLAQFETGDLGDGIPLVGRLERAGQQRAFRHRLRCQARIDAGGAEEQQLRDAGAPCSTSNYNSCSDS